MAEEERDETRDRAREEARIKVTDKRMFTADGELREGYQPSKEAAPANQPEPPRAVEPLPDRAAESLPDRAVEPVRAAATEAPPQSTDVGGEEPPLDLGGLGSPGFMELISVLAEPIAVYMGDAKMPDGSSAENPEAARFYIDLLEVLQQKTQGNLSVQEAGILEDLLYQLRMRYVRQRG